MHAGARTLSPVKRPLWFFILRGQVHEQRKCFVSPSVWRKGQLPAYALIIHCRMQAGHAPPYGFCAVCCGMRGTVAHDLGSAQRLG